MPAIHKKPKPIPVLGREGDALWFVRVLLPKNLNEKSVAAGDLLAIGCRMSEADRRRLVQIVKS